MGEDGKPVEKLRSVEYFFTYPFNNFIAKFNLCIFIVFVIFIAFMGYSASQIGPLTKQEEFLPEDHWFTQVSEA